MKRKIILQGNNSYTLTLPVKWVRDMRLEEGCEVDVTEEERNLVISPQFTDRKKEISILLEESYEKNVRFLLNEMYRQGYDTIRINTKEPKTIKLVQKLVEELFFEMDVIDKKDNYCVIEMISQPSFDNYHAILKKLVFIIRESMDVIMVAIKTKKYDGLKELDVLTGKYRKYDNFCRRYVFNNIRGRENFGMTSLLIQLLMIQTDLRRLGTTARKTSRSDELLFDEVITSYNSAYKAFFDKDMRALYSVNRKINQSLTDKTSGTSASKKCCTIFACQCLQMLRIMYSAIVPMIGLSMEIKKLDA